MKNKNVNADKNRLDDLFARITTIQDNKLRTEWARYLIIRVSGFLEYALRELLVDYVRRVAHKNIANFVEKELEHRTNLKMEKLAQLIGSFNPQWETEIREAAEFSEYKEALDTIVTARNNLSHGKNAIIPFVRVKDYYKSILKLLELIETQTTR